MAELDYIERTVVIREQGSIEFTPDELAADIVIVDVKCTALAGTIYTNKRTLPDYGYYGAVTLFGGATVEEKIPLDFVYQRVLDSERDYRRIMCYLSRLELRIRDIEAKVKAPDNVPPVGVGELPRAFDYRGLFYSKMKIKSTVAAQWNVTVRRWKEFSPFLCQSVNKSDDPTKGEPEYPVPVPITDPENYPPGLPDPTLPYPGADPNDFPPGSPAAYPRPVEFGTKVFASDGQGQPDNCTQNVELFEIFVWQDAGQGPYTVALANISSPCVGRTQGYVIVAADGSQSPVQAAGATVYSAVINTFTLV